MAKKSSQSGSMGVAAEDGKYYASGGSGKEFVYNPTTGNIGVTKNGQTHYVSPSDSNYQTTLNAARADIGSSTWGSGNGSSGSLTNDLYQGTQNLANTQQQAYNIIDNSRNEYFNLLTKAVSLLIEGLEAQRPQILDAAKNANTGAYNAYKQVIDPYGMLAESNAGLGLGNSGYAESSKVKIGNQYQNALNANELAKQQQLNELELAKQQAQLDAMMSKADASASFADKLAQYTYNSGQDIYNAQTSAAKAAQEERLREQQLKYLLNR